MMRRNLAAASLCAATIATTADAFPQQTWIAGGSISSSYHIDGDASTARFNNPSSVAIVADTDAIYVADKTNHVVRSIVASTGLTTTFAGTSRSLGSTNDVGTAAKFYNPFGIAVDSSGAAFLVDEGNNAIRKITSGATVTTVAGGTYGFADDTGTAAKFRNPEDLALMSGTAYVADATNYLVRKVVLDTGVVTTVAGTTQSKGEVDAVGTNAKFGVIGGIAVDSNGVIYVTDQTVHKIRKIATDGTVSHFSGSGTKGTDDGSATAASFNLPGRLTIDGSDNLYVSNWKNMVRRVSSTGEVKLMATIPHDVNAVTVSSGADKFYTVGGTAGYVGAFATAQLTDAPGMEYPTLGSVAMFTSPYVGPSGVAADTVNGGFVVADTSRHTIYRVSSSGTGSTIAGSFTSGLTDATGTAAVFHSPYGIEIDATGNIIVADLDNHAIRKITSANVVSTLAGTGSSGYVNSATGTVAEFYRPYDIAIVGTNIFVADDGNYVVRKIDATGAVTRYAGVQGSASNTVGGDGVGEFRSLDAIAATSDSTLYVADRDNNMIRKVSPELFITTFAGTGVSGSADGDRDTATFNSIKGLAVNADGFVFVTDSGNNKLRIVSAAGTTTTPTVPTSIVLDDPRGIAVATNGDVFMASFKDDQVVSIVSALYTTTAAAETTTTAAPETTSASSSSDSASSALSVLAAFIGAVVCIAA